MQGGSIKGGTGTMKAYVAPSFNWDFLLAVQEGTDLKMVKVSSTPTNAWSIVYRSSDSSLSLVLLVDN